MNTVVPSDGSPGYRVVRRLATGGTSDVLLAKMEGNKNDEHVVLKILLALYRDDPSFERMFSREAAAYGRLQHPCIVRLIDFFSADNQLVMVLEYVDGVSLHRLRNAHKSPLDDRACLYIARSIFSALAAAHGANHPETGDFAPVIHRDVNPSNILLTWHGDVKLADFGIAKVTGVAGDTKTGFIKGTFGYMSPEQVRGEAITVRTDIYAAMLILWELLAWRRAHDEMNLSELELMRAMAHPKLASLDSLRPDLHRDIRALVARGLEPEPERRDLTADEALAILDAHVTKSEGRAALFDALSRARAELSRTSFLPPPSGPFRAPDSQTAAGTLPAPEELLAHGTSPKGDSDPAFDAETKQDVFPLTKQVTDDQPTLLSSGSIQVLEPQAPPPPPPASVRTGMRPPSVPRPFLNSGTAAIKDGMKTQPSSQTISLRKPSLGRLPAVSAGLVAPVAPVTPVSPVAGPPSPAFAAPPARDPLHSAPQAQPVPLPPPPVVLPGSERFASRPPAPPAPDSPAFHQVSMVPISLANPAVPPPVDLPGTMMSPRPPPPMDLPGTMMSPHPPPVDHRFGPAFSPPYLQPLPRSLSVPEKRSLRPVLFGILALGGAVVCVVLFVLIRGMRQSSGGAVSSSTPVKSVEPNPIPSVTIRTPVSAAVTSAPPVHSALAPTPTSPIPTEAPTQEAPTATEGTLLLPARAAGHRVFVDGHVTGDGARTLKLPCGSHSVRIGSRGKGQTVSVPCGGEVSLK